MLTLPCLALLVACEPTKRDPYPVFVDTGDDDPVNDTSDTGTDTGTDTSDTGTPVVGDPVEVGFTGRIVTVTGTPFGLYGLEDSDISGSFTYDRAVADSEPTDPDRGTYDHRVGTGSFSLSVGGRVVGGSGNPIVKIEFGDTFRWTDGPVVGDPVDRVCTIDGIDDAFIQIGLSFTPTNTEDPFPDDTLPAVFPFVDWDLQNDVAITFFVEDGASGTFLMELNALTTE